MADISYYSDDGDLKRKLPSDLLFNQPKFYSWASYSDNIVTLDHPLLEGC
jgi:hypothetical protein